MVLLIFARILSVCRTFLTFREDVSILKVVRFNNEIQCNNLYMYRKVNGLLIRCSEAGNTAARFLLGKVVLLSSSQFISECQNIILAHRPSDCATLCRILATNHPIRNTEMVSFMRYFRSQRASTSEALETRLVHHQLVKVFLYYCSPRDMFEMGEVVTSYFEYLAGINEKEELLECVELMALLASRFRIVEELAEIKHMHDQTFMMLSEIWAWEVERHYEDPSSTPVPQEFDEFVKYYNTILGDFLFKYELATFVWQVELNGDARDFNTAGRSIC